VESNPWYSLHIFAYIFTSGEIAKIEKDNLNPKMYSSISRNRKTKNTSSKDQIDMFHSKLKKPLC
jgi:hypothetical protein